MATMAAQALLGGSPARAAMVDPGTQSEMRRGVAMVGPTVSEEPAVRLERQKQEPSAGFMLGAALGAWTSAAASLDYDLKNPSGDGDDTQAIGIDCYDERTAFTHLESRRSALGLTPAQVIESAGLSGKLAASAWLERQAGPPKRCR
jgi:hypothetical protein